MAGTEIRNRAEIAAGEDDNVKMCSFGVAMLLDHLRIFTDKIVFCVFHNTNGSALLAVSFVLIA
jgi:hypothetical protein